jgi:hypothetical protein
MSQGGMTLPIQSLAGERVCEDDQAALVAGLFLAAALAAVPKPAGGRVYTGWCANCDAGVDEPALWCDADCQADFERRERRAVGA